MCEVVEKAWIGGCRISVFIKNHIHPFNLHIPHAPRLRGFNLLLEMEGGESETVCLVEAVCIGVDAGTVPSSIPLRNVKEAAFAAKLTSFWWAFYGF